MESILNKFEAYLLTEKCVALNTLYAYVKDIEQFALFAKSQKKSLEKTDAALLKRYLLQLKKEKVSPRSMARKISSLKVFFKWAATYYGWENPATDLIFPKIEKKLPSYLSQEEICHLLETAQKDSSDTGKRNWVMLSLLYTTGMRVSELSNLLIHNIHFSESYIRVMGKGNKERIIPLPSPILALAQDYCDTVHTAFRKKYPTSYLFPSVYGAKIRPITRQSFWAILKDLCKKAGIEKKVSPHMLRHSLATHLLQKGAHLRSLQMLLGHENLSTVEIYTHVEMEQVRIVYNKKHPRS